MTVTTIPSNILLSTLTQSARASLLRHATAVDLPAATVLDKEATLPHFSYFLLSGLACAVVTTPAGESAEVGFIGREGVVGGSHLLGPATLSCRCVMQLPGLALRIPFSDLQQAFDSLPEVRSCVLEFVQEQSAGVAQIAGCNRLHGAEQRLIRWLLMAQDRTGYDTLDFTHECLSQMISTQRSTVTVIAGVLQRRGLIEYSRGKIHILDRAGLEASTCVCYPIMKRLLHDLYQRDAAQIQA